MIVNPKVFLAVSSIALNLAVAGEPVVPEFQSPMQELEYSLGRMRVSTQGFSTAIRAMYEDGNESLFRASGALWQGSIRASHVREILKTNGPREDACFEMGLMRSNAHDVLDELRPILSMAAAPASSSETQDDDMFESLSLLLFLDGISPELSLQLEPTGSNSAPSFMSLAYDICQGSSRFTSEQLQILVNAQIKVSERMLGNLQALRSLISTNAPEPLSEDADCKTICCSYSYPCTATERLYLDDLPVGTTFEIVAPVTLTAIQGHGAIARFAAGRSVPAADRGHSCYIKGAAAGELAVGISNYVGGAHISHGGLSGLDLYQATIPVVTSSGGDVVNIGCSGYPGSPTVADLKYAFGDVVRIVVPEVAEPQP